MCFGVHAIKKHWLFLLLAYLLHLLHTRTTVAIYAGSDIQLLLLLLYILLLACWSAHAPAACILLTTPSSHTSHSGFEQVCQLLAAVIEEFVDYVGLSITLLCVRVYVC